MRFCVFPQPCCTVVRCCQVPEAFCDNNRRGGTMEQEDDMEVPDLGDPLSFSSRLNYEFEWLGTGSNMV